MEMNHVLVVEDDKEIREGVEIYLKSQGYEVFQAADGIEGLEVIEKEEIHLAIVDIMMPRMDGIRMTMKLREKYDFPVIMLSAKSEEVDKIMGLNIGADDYVTKPFNPLELVTGGVTGLAILLEHLFHIPLWLVNAAVNIPLFIIGYKVLGKLIFYRTVYATVCLSVFLGLIRPLPLLTGDVLVDGLCGGVIMGGGLGLIFLQNASSGGADMTAQIINRRIPHVSVPKLMAIVDGIIILFGIGVFGLRNGIYALIVLFVMTKVSDLVLEGPNHAKLMYIIY